jgi:RNA polymerase sigma-70 factor (ECF subfamily)
MRIKRDVIQRESMSLPPLEGLALSKFSGDELLMSNTPDPMSHVTRITSYILDFYGDTMNVAAGELIENDEGSPRSVTAQRADEPSDEQLMARLGGSEIEAALSVLYDRYSRTVFGVGLKILGDRSLAEELVQDVFLKVWRSSHTFDPSRGSFSTWLYRVTRSCALDLYRKRAHKVRQVSNGAVHIDAVRDSSDGPQEIVDESWLSWRVSRALEVLDAPHREVIELAYFSGLSQREISERTGVPLGTVKSRTASAFRSLRKYLVAQDTSRGAIG